MGMRTISTGISLVLLVVAVPVADAFAQPVKAYNIRMRRSDMPDLTDIDSILATTINGSMSDEEKSKAIWRLVVQFRHQDSPPAEKIGPYIQDPIKMFNVYGYNFCSMAGAAFQALAERAGLQARPRGINAHNVVESYYNGDWHLLDPSLITYFRDAGGEIASVDEIVQSVQTWCASNGNCGDNAYLRNFMRSGGWLNGPTVLATSQWYDNNGWLPAATHGWYSNVEEYDGSTNVVLNDGYSSGYVFGHRALLTLRENETLVRSCANTGNKHINQFLGGGKPGCIDRTAGSGDMAYLNRRMPVSEFSNEYYFHEKYTGGIVGNGTLSYSPSLADGNYRGGIESESNMASTADDAISPALHPASAGAADVIFKMQSPYVILEGAISATFYRRNVSQTIQVAVSTNNMLDWTTVHTVTGTGTVSASIDTSSLTRARYAYYVKISLTGTGPGDVGIEALTISNLFQHHQRALPFLVEGSNTILLEGGGPVQTISVNGRLTNDPTFTVNETQATFGAIVNNCTLSDGYCWKVDTWPASTGSITFPVTVPGDVVDVRFGGVFRVNNSGDTARLQVSTVGPNTGFVTVGTVTGPIRRKEIYVSYQGVPAGVRNLWVRYEMDGTDTIGLMGHYRIDVDYQEAGGVDAPFIIRHDWTDAGGAQFHEETVASLPHTYSITAATGATMDALTVSVPQAASIVPETDPPVLALTDLILTGTVSEPSAAGTLTDTGGTPILIQPNGSFSYTLATTGSTSLLTLTLTDGAGDSSQRAVTVNR